MLHYILQVVLFQLLFLIVYDVFLRKETFFNLNRVYLLGTAVLSIAIPFMKIEQIKNVVAKDLVIRLPEIIIGNSTEDFSTINPEIAMQAGLNLDPDPISIWNIIVISGMCIATLILMIKISKLMRLASKQPKRWSGNLLIIELLNSTKAFSFFHYIFLGQKLNTQEKSAILEHEMVHVHEKHTLDLLFFELLRIVFWFNPLVYMYQKRIATLHEYLADAKAVKYHNKAKYYDNLLAQVFETQQFSFVNPFFKQSLIKKRILMLSKSKSRQINLSRYLLIIPLILGMLVYSSCSVFKSKQKNEIVEIEIEAVETPNSKPQHEVPFSIIDEVPVFKSCEALETNIERKKCVNQAISKYVNMNFNTSIADSLGFVGKQRINVIFKIDKEGYVIDVKARAPHPVLEEEAKRVIKNLPRFSPGKHKDKTVIVPYSLPIVFQIKGNSSTLANNQINEFKENLKNASEVPFTVVDQVPIFKSCEDFKTNEARKKCTSQNISKYVNLNFNTSIADSLGLVGKQRMNVIFKIDKEGYVIDVKARAPHPTLEEEAKRVIKSLPQFSPGKHKDRTVIVPYSLPIVFQIQGTSKTQAKEDANEVPFMALDEAPGIGECSGLSSSKEQKTCFSKYVSRYVTRNYNVGLASNLGLVGRQRTNVIFKIDKQGLITEARARAPHPELEAEALRVINSLPQFTPGKLNGKPVVVTYSLPILFQIAADSKQDKKN
ncbi:hypothetical protein A9Q86_14905 [Flavobacteriales bacterium 33_180_T64]|nr:hypothetical protein A9Q86_14905 [Flavobacteriales bacterium 33_180_T64]